MISHYFDNFNPTEIKNFRKSTNRNISNGLKFFSEKFPAKKEVEIALVGLSNNIHIIRESLYQLQFPFRNVRLADLGNIKGGDPVFLNPVINQLLDREIIPIVISDSFDHFRPISLAFEQRKKHYHFTHISRDIPLSSHSPFSESMGKLLERDPLYLEGIDLIGYQEHLCDTSVVFKDSFTLSNYVSLGQAKSNLEEIEPYIRNANLVSIDMSSIKWSDAPGQNDPAPSGFLSEEVCQLSRYAGINENLRCLFIHGFNFEKDVSNITAKSIAEIIWYFLDGMNVRNLTEQINSEVCTEYMVDSKYLETPIVFVRNNQTDKWWFHFEQNRPVDEVKKLLACSYEDYLGACNEELSERMIRAIKRFAYF